MTHCQVRVTSRGDDKSQGGHKVFMGLQFLCRSLSNFFLAKLPSFIQFVFIHEAVPVPAFQIWEVPDISLLTSLLPPSQYLVNYLQEVMNNQQQGWLCGRGLPLLSRTLRWGVDPGCTLLLMKVRTRSKKCMRRYGWLHIHVPVCLKECLGK